MTTKMQGHLCWEVELKAVNMEGRRDAGPGDELETGYSYGNREDESKMSHNP